MANQTSPNATRDGLAEKACAIFGAYVASPTAHDRFDCDIEKRVFGFATTCVDAEMKRLRRFRVLIVAFAVLVVAAACGLAVSSELPALVIVPAAFITYLVFVMLPAFELRLRFSGRYGKQIEEDLAKPDHESLRSDINFPLGLRFHVLEADSSIRLTYSVLILCVAVALITLGRVQLFPASWHIPNFSAAGDDLAVASTALVYVAVVAILPQAAVGLARREIIPKAAPVYLPDRDAFVAASDIATASIGVTGSQSVRRFLILRLETLASLYERNMPAALGLRNAPEDAAAVAQFARMARQIRDLKIWVVSPHKRTAEDLERQMSIVACALTTRRFHWQLESFDTASADGATPLLPPRLLTVLGQIAVALTPGLLLFVAIRGGILPTTDRQLIISLIIFSVSWAFANLAAARPGSRDVVGMTKDITSSVPHK